MGRSVKYPTIRKTYSTTGVVIPTGSTATRPSTAADGTFRYNSDTAKFELYQNGSWINPTSRGKVTITKDTFTGTGSQTAFTLSLTPNDANGIQVYVGNVHQNPTTAYTVSSTTLTFNVAPPNAQTIEVYHGFDSTDR